MARKKAGKWANQVGTIPEEQKDTVSPWFKKVLEEKDTLQGLSMAELDAKWAALEAEDEAVEEARKARNIKYEALEMRILEEIERIKTISGQESWRGNGTLITPKRVLRPSVKDKAALRAWVEEHDMEAMLELPSGRLNSLVTDAFDTENASILTPAQRATLSAGMPGSQLAPPGVEVFMKTTVNRTARGKAPSKTEEE